MPTLDVFKADGFSLMSLTEAILKAPHKPGRIGELGLFRERGITTTVVAVEEKDGRLELITTSQRGAPGGSIGEKKRTLRNFSVPHLARQGVITADQVQNIRAWGTENEETAVQALVDEYLMDLRRMHEVTLEHLRIGALKGNILDADGSTVLFNLFTEFNVTQQTTDIVLSVATTDVRGSCVAIARQVESELGADTYTRLRGFCGASFFDTLVKHAEVKKSYENQEGFVLRQDLRANFEFGGIAWEEYRGKVGSVEFIDTNQAFVFPEGTNIFATHFAPADYMETVNTLGLPIYAKVLPDPSGANRFNTIDTQSNPLPLCLRPKAVVKVTKS